MNSKNRIFKISAFLTILIVYVFLCLFIMNCVENGHKNANNYDPDASKIIKEKAASQDEIDLINSEHKAYEDKQKKINLKNESSQKEKAWVAAQCYEPLLLNDGRGTTFDNVSNLKITFYSSKSLYHKDTPKWQADVHGFWRAWDGNEWCFVVSCNSNQYQYGDKIQLGKMGTGWVLDSGCKYGVCDMYVNWERR